MAFTLMLMFVICKKSDSLLVKILFTWCIFFFSCVSFLCSNILVLILMSWSYKVTLLIHSLWLTPKGMISYVLFLFSFNSILQFIHLKNYMQVVMWFTVYILVNFLQQGQSTLVGLPGPSGEANRSGINSDFSGCQNDVLAGSRQFDVEKWIQEKTFSR